MAARGKYGGKTVSCMKNDIFSQVKHGDGTATTTFRGDAKGP